MPIDKFCLVLHSNIKSSVNTKNAASQIMTKVNFLDSYTINVVARDGETFILNSYLPVPVKERKKREIQLKKSFEKHFSEDSSSMVYWVLIDVMGTGFAFFCERSDQRKERDRIGVKIRKLREGKGIEAKNLAVMANIDAANLSRIENGKYSVGFDILSKIASALGVKVDLVEI